MENVKGINLNGLITPLNIYDCDTRETLELVWTLILRLEIRVFSDDGLKGEECLLAWAAKITKAYAHPDMVVKNFNNSWKSGLPFVAILNHYRPALIDFEKYRDVPSQDACEAAFAAAQSIGIPPILDIEDIVDVVPEESVVMTYLAKFYALFADHVSRVSVVHVCVRAFLIFTCTYRHTARILVCKNAHACSQIVSLVSPMCLCLICVCL